jgi:Ser/Thr protein kinase RdoA (MazF antagonist)
MQDPETLCRAWNIAPLLAARVPETGTIHQTLLLETSAGNYALRTYRYPPEKRWRVEAEHALIAYVCTQNIPAMAPLPLPNGDTILEHNSRLHALFPFARGYQTKRGKITSEETIAMGVFLARLHRALHDYPQDKVANRIFSVDHATTLDTISKIEAIIQARPQPEDDDTQALIRLRERRSWLETAQPPDETAFAQIEQQVIHGDYQETNLFFADNTVSAVIDWDQSYAAPRAWEVTRALHYLFQFNPAPCHLFLQSYRRELPLSSEELDITANVYSWIRTHDMWLYEEYYLQGNQRVRQFYSPHAFRPLIERWHALQHELKTSFA